MAEFCFSDVPEVHLKNSAAGVSWHDSAYRSRRSLEPHRLSPQSARYLEETSERQFLQVSSRWRQRSSKITTRG